MFPECLLFVLWTPCLWCVTTDDMPHLPFDLKRYPHYTLCHCQYSVFQFFTKYNYNSIPLTILLVIVKFVSGTDLSCFTSLPFRLLYAQNLQALLSHQLCDFSTSSGHTSDIECCYFTFLILLPLSRTNFFNRPGPPDGSPCPFFVELRLESRASLTGYAIAWALSPLSVIHMDLA